MLTLAEPFLHSRATGLILPNQTCDMTLTYLYGLILVTSIEVLYWLESIVYDSTY
jgi:hypothetical protein